MGAITIVIEALELDKSITRKEVPFYTVRDVCISRERGVQYLYELQSNLNISSCIQEEILFIDNEPGFNLGRRYVFLKEAIVYGDIIRNHAYHLRDYSNRFNYRNPYGYINLGWYSSIEWCKRTREWQIIDKIANYMYDGYEDEKELKIYPFKSHSIDLYIAEFTIIK